MHLVSLRDKDHRNYRKHRTHNNYKGKDSDRKM